jgi:hypothetical protein
MLDCHFVPLAQAKIAKFSFAAKILTFFCFTMEYHCWKELVAKIGPKKGRHDSLANACFLAIEQFAKDKAGGSEMLCFVMFWAIFFIVDILNDPQTRLRNELLTQLAVKRILPDDQNKLFASNMYRDVLATGGDLASQVLNQSGEALMMLRGKTRDNILFPSFTQEKNFLILKTVNQTLQSLLNNFGPEMALVALPNSYMPDVPNKYTPRGALSIDGWAQTDLDHVLYKPEVKKPVVEKLVNKAKNVEGVGSQKLVSDTLEEAEIAAELQKLALSHAVQEELKEMKDAQIQAFLMGPLRARAIANVTAARILASETAANIFRLLRP